MTSLIFIFASVVVITVSCLYLLVCVDKYDTGVKGRVRDFAYSLPN